MTWCLELVFREIYTFSQHFFTGPINIESLRKLLKKSLVKICCGPTALLKRDYGAVVFLKHKSAPKVISQ